MISVTFNNRNSIRGDWDPRQGLRSVIAIQATPPVGCVIFIKLLNRLIAAPTPVSQNFYSNQTECWAQSFLIQKLIPY